MQGEKPLRVRVNVHRNIERADNMIFVEFPWRDRQKFTLLPVAFATSIILKNVRPAIDRPLAALIAGGQSPRVPVAWLEGDLESLVGDCCPYAIKDFPEQVAKLSQKKCLEIFNAAACGTRQLLQADVINFNPNKSGGFYKCAPDADLQIFDGAELALIHHWRYTVVNGAYHPANSTDVPMLSLPREASVTAETEICRRLSAQKIAELACFVK